MGSRGSKLDIYWNIREHIWSVLDRRQGMVVLHQSSLIANDVSFVVQGAGRQRVIATGRKNVHAFVRAESIKLLQADPNFLSSDFVRVRYNPYKCSCFIDDNFEPIKKAGEVILTSEGKCYAKRG